jgi:hypothetical protein
MTPTLHEEVLLAKIRSYLLFNDFNPKLLRNKLLGSKVMSEDVLDFLLKAIYVDPSHELDMTRFFIGLKGVNIMQYRANYLHA